MSPDAAGLIRVEASRVKALGWRQGSILSRNLLKAVLEKQELGELEADVGVVVSHDCDVTNSSWEAEPNVELLVGRMVKDPDKSLWWRKNPRRLQIPHEGVFLEFRVRDRIVVEREYLVGEEPAGRVDEQQLREIRGWITARYLRAAFPDEFNLRSRSAVQTLRRYFKKVDDCGLLNAIYILIADEELGPDRAYQIMLIGTMHEADYQVPESRERARTVLLEIESELGGCAGIDLIDAELRSEADLSVADLRSLKRWDFDDLTIRDGEAPAEAVG
jgi:hypothetical protein